MSRTLNKRAFINRLVSHDRRMVEAQDMKRTLNRHQKASNILQHYQGRIKARRLFDVVVLYVQKVLFIVLSQKRGKNYESLGFTSSHRKSAGIRGKVKYLNC